MNRQFKLKQALKALTPSCREAARLQSQQMDLSLGLAQRIGLRIHLLLCKWCRRYGIHIRFLRAASRQSAEEQEKNLPGMPTETRNRIQRKLSEARK